MYIHRTVTFLPSPYLLHLQLSEHSYLLVVHSLMSSLQSGPVQPGGHVHTYDPSSGEVSHEASELHGLLWQASSRWHSKPVNYIRSLSHAYATLPHLAHQLTHITITVFAAGHNWTDPYRQVITVLNTTFMYQSWRVDTRSRSSPHGHDKCRHCSKVVWHNRQC